MVAKYVCRGAPTRSDGWVPWPSIQTWVRNNIVSSRSGSWWSRQRAEAASNSASKEEESEGSDYPTTLNIAWALTAPEHVEKFARLAIAAGCSQQQSMLLAEAACSWALDAVDVNENHLPNDEVDWHKVFGPDFDLEAAERAFDALMSRRDVMPAARTKKT